MGILRTFKRSLVNQSELSLKKISGKEYLNKDQTIDYLKDYLILPNQQNNIKWPDIRNVANSNQIIFDKNEAEGSRNYAWNYKSGGKKSFLLRIGSVCTDNKVLETDYGYPNLFTDDFGGKQIFKDMLTHDKRKTCHTETLIAPWSHYFRPEYYGFTYFVAAKLSRIKDIVPEKIFNEAILSYPLFNTNYESDFLSLLGFKQEQIIDSREKKITFETCILGNNDNWSYPNVYDILSLKRCIESKVRISQNAGGKRIYICRSGRRRVLNEKILIKVLEKYEFDIIEDKPRSVEEQFSIYNNASFIMGPHGASFSNIIGCKPGTHLFELFPSTYVYNFFLYIAQVMGMSYSAYCNGPVIPYGPYRTVNDDIVVDTDEIEQYLEKVLKNH